VDVCGCEICFGGTVVVQLQSSSDYIEMTRRERCHGRSSRDGVRWIVLFPCASPTR